jgi:hypothetical protein
MYPKILPGKRATIAGRTGSGKTTLACWLLKRSPLHWVILNPKHTAGYSTLPDCNVITSLDLKKISKSIESHKFTLINPGLGEANPETLDLVIEWLHNNYQSVGLCCDELYTLHTGGQCGPGLIAWLTRGRELKQSFIGLTQRPAWISLFCFSEADYLGEMDLQLKKDRQRFFEFTGNPASLQRLPPRKWLWYEAEADTLQRFGAVPV